MNNMRNTFVRRHDSIKGPSDRKFLVLNVEEDKIYGVYDGYSGYDEQIFIEDEYTIVGTSFGEFSPPSSIEMFDKLYNVWFSNINNAKREY